ncbi:hypothetical protein [Microbacterium sp. XT11]|uniref:hypothetical protein n=1 Tax=Microbacterium sp. XT11 TaxID=367477 RepID=UPI00082982EB|nr:hypothetical protein [Microbacterium sp. XT11]
MILAVATVPPPQQTEAAWVDQELATAAVTALNVPEPVTWNTPGCVASGGALGLNPTVTIYWRVPAGVSGYSASSAEYAQITGGLLPSLLDPLLGGTSTTGSESAYTTVISGALLSGLLGGSKSFGIRFVYPGPVTPAPSPDNRWRSDWLVATASIGLAGSNPQCTLSTLRSY